MYRNYPDLHQRLGAPIWYDDQGVPRYDPFHPDLGGVYDTLAALLEIACQGCDRRFTVGSSWSWTKAIEAGGSVREAMRPTATNGGGDFGFGDAPPHEADGSYGCVGCTMTTSVTRVLEFWVKENFEPWGPEEPGRLRYIGRGWVRHPEYEFAYGPA